MTTDDSSAADVPYDTGPVEPGERAGGAAPGLAGLLALAELGLHLRLTAALATSADPTVALRVAAVSARHLDRAARLAERVGAEALAVWEPSVDLLLRVPAADWLEGVTGAHVVGGVLDDLAALAPGVGGDRADGSDDGLAGAMRRVTDADPSVTGRLSLFGRRVFGRVLLSGRQIAALLPETESAGVSAYLGGAGDVFARRMGELGLKG